MLHIDEQMPMMNIEERRTTMEPTEILEDIPLDESNPKKFTRIETSMEEKTKQKLVQFLKKSTDVFAWSHEEITHRLNVITHRLNASSSYKPVRQRPRLTSLFVKRKESLPQKEIRK